MDIKEIKAEKRRVEDEISAIINKFEKEAGLMVSDIEVIGIRDSTDDSYAETIVKIEAKIAN